MTHHRILIVLPARAGSVGVWSKHERPIWGEPLAASAIKRAMNAAAMIEVSPLYSPAPELEGHSFSVEVAVTSDDPDVLARARMFEDWDPGPDLIHADGSVVGEPHPIRLRVLDRATSAALSHPATPITAPVTDALRQLDEADVEPYEVVAIHQMTSPTLTAKRIAGLILTFVLHPDRPDSASTMTPHYGFLWANGGPIQNDRVNRQLQDELWAETGGLHLTRNYPRTDGWWGPDAPQIGPQHQTIEVTADEAVDVDTSADVAHAETVLNRWRTLIVTRGDAEVGTGHLRRAAAIAAELDPWSNVEVWCVDTPDEYERAHIPDRWRTDTSDIAADVIIVDVLDHPLGAKLAAEAGDHVIRFECDDLNCGAAHHVNALRSTHRLVAERVHEGPDWFDLRWEFMGLPPRRPSRDNPILVSFGGTDPADHSAAVARSLGEAGFPVTVVRPPNRDRLIVDRGFPAGVSEVRRPHMATLMRDSSMIFTGRGRTAFEAAYLGLPVVTLAANSREENRNIAPAHSLAGSVDSAASVAEAWLRSDDPGLYERLVDEAGAIVDGLGLTRIRHLAEMLATETRRPHR